MEKNATTNTLTLKQADKNVKLSEQQEHFYKLLNNILTDPKTITVWAYKNSAKIDIGSYQQGAIDLGDIQKHNSISDAEPTTGGTAEGVLIHELVEQFELQKSDVGPNDKSAKDARFNDDHQAGINAENQVNGNTRLREKEQISEGNRVDFLHNNPYYYKYYRQKDNTILEERISVESKDMQINKKVIPE